MLPDRLLGELRRSGIDPRYAQPLEKVTDEAARSLVGKLAEAIRRERRMPRGILICGPRGEQRGICVAHIALAAIESGFRTWCVKVSDIADEENPLVRQDLLDWARGTRLLVLDLDRTGRATSEARLARSILTERLEVLSPILLVAPYDLEALAARFYDDEPRLAEMLVGGAFREIALSPVVPEPKNRAKDLLNL